MRKILITNASSCLGINLAIELLKQEDVFVYAYDGYLSKNTPSLYTLLKNDRYSFTERDLTLPIECMPDITYHLSPCLNKERYLRDKYDYIKNEFEILDNILNHCSITGSKLIFVNYFNDYSSSNSLYYSYFDFIKSMHNITNEFSKRDKISVKFAQISQYYGINSTASADNFIGEAIVKSYNNEEIAINQDEYIYLTNVSDIVSALIKITENYSEFESFDISVSSQVLKSEVIKFIISNMTSNSKLAVKEPYTEKPSYIPNLSNLNDGLSYSCTTNINKGVLETINFYKTMYFS